MKRSLPPDDKGFEELLAAALKTRAARVQPAAQEIDERVQRAARSTTLRSTFAVWARLATVAAVLVVGVALVVSAGNPGAVATPRPSSSSTAGTASSAPTGSSATGAVYEDGIPSVLGGQPVLRPAAALAHAAAATDDAQFLLGGWERPPAPKACIALTLHVLSLSGCGRPSLVEASGTEFDTRLGITGTAEVRLAALPDTLRLQSYAPVVLVVHVHDAQARQCTVEVAECLSAVVVDRVAWSDDIPSSIDGTPVLSIYQGLAQAATASTSQSFLIGGWFAGFGLTCAAPDPNPPTSSLVPSCDGVVLTDTPYELIVANHDTQAPFIQPIFLDGAAVGLVPRSGRVAYRVHIHDGSAASCPASLLARCQKAVVVDALIWQGIPPFVPLAGRPTVSVPPTAEPAPTSLPACTSGDLATSLAGWGAAEGTTYAAVRLALTTPSSCSLPSLPGASLLAPSGAVLVTSGLPSGARVALSAALDVRVGLSSMCGTAPISLILDFGGGNHVRLPLPGGFGAPCHGTSQVSVDPLYAP